MVATTRSSKHNPALDGVRGAAIIIVLVYNSFAAFYHPGPESSPVLAALARLSHVGWSGVTLFFVLSGYLIGGILLDHREDEHYFRTFFARRFFRIVPLYFVVISPLFLFPLLRVGEWAPKLAEFATTGEIPRLCYPLFLQNIGMAANSHWGPRWLDTTWSLAVEEQFYILAALVIRFLPPRHFPKLLVALIVSAPLLRLLLVLTLPPLQAAIGCYVLLPCRWDALAAGMMFAWSERRWGSAFVPALNSPGARYLLTASFAGAAVLLLMAPDPTNRLTAVLGHSAAAIACAAVFAGALGAAPFLKRVMEFRILAFAGLISYGLYLLHEPIISLVTRVTLGTREITSPFALWMTLAGVATAVTAATASWYLFERHLVRIGHRFRYTERSLADQPSPRTVHA